MRSRYVGPLRLPAELYRRLEQMALAEERDTLQQARWLLRQALITPEASEPETPQRSEDDHADARPD